jgi:imidazolonepropionase-like amidohydrolase
MSLQKRRLVMRNAVFVIAVLAGGAQAQTVATAPAEAVLFENVRVFDGKSDRLTAPVNVLVAGNTTQSISAGPITAPAGSKFTRIAGRGRALMPGLIDNHVHIVMTASTQAEMINPKTTFASIEGKGAEEVRQMLLRGFTTVRDLGGPSFGIKTAIDSGKAVGPRIYPSGAMISQTSGHGDSRLPTERSRRFFGKPSIG